MVIIYVYEGVRMVCCCLVFFIKGIVDINMEC